MRWPYPRVLAHRGGGRLAPENTLAAIRVGQRHGYRAIEFDVMLSAEGEPVLMHDATLERTTDGTGAVAAHTLAQLQRLDAGRWFAPEFSGVRIPRLDEVVGYCRGQGIWMNVEIKPSPGAEVPTGRQVAACLASLYGDPAQLAAACPPAPVPDPDRPLLSSFSQEALAAALEAAPGFARGLLVGQVPCDFASRLASLKCVALHCDHRCLDRPTVKAIHDAGYWVFCYTVNEPMRAAELIAWGVDGLCTDELMRIDPTAFDRP